MRAVVFAKRNLKEILRDPLSYVFCMGFPVVMLIGFYVAFSSTAPWFAMDILAPGIAIFSFAFVMLYIALLISKDRATSFLSRLYTSPMAKTDFVFGYTLPALLIAFGQVVVCFTTAYLIGLVSGTPLSSIGVVFSIVTTLPAMLLFIGFGILFGSLFSDKAAPGISSIVITLSGFLSGAWIPVDPQSALGLVWCVFPFYPAVSVGRVALSLEQATFMNFWSYLLIVCAYAVAVFTLSVVVFKKKTSNDNA